MSSEDIGFADLGELNEQTERWLRERRESMRFLESLGEDRVFRALSERLVASRDGGGSFPDGPELSELLYELGEPLGLPSDAREMLRRSTVVTIAVSGALAKILETEKPDLASIENVASVESFLDVTILAERVRAGRMAGEWLEFLRKTTLNIHTINDDEYHASDELERWRKEVVRAVPRWREGDFPHRGVEALELISALLKALDQDAWLRFLDGLPLPAMIEAALWRQHVERAPAVLLDWIRASPPAFDETGSRTSGALVFVLERRALRLIENDLMRRSQWGRDDDQSRELMQRGAKARADLVAAIRSRVDGAVLAAELAGRSMLMSQVEPGGDSRTKLRHALYQTLGGDYARSLGPLPDATQQLQLRGDADESRSAWALWLAVAAYASEVAQSQGEDAARSVLRDCWTWLRALLVAKDPELAERHAPFSQWTERLAGIALGASAEPVSELEQAWAALAPQRLVPQENKYTADSWATSRFLIRAACFAWHGTDVDEIATKLWTKANEMAISAWFADSNGDAFAELVACLAHLAKGRRPVEDQPELTFGYLVGLPVEVSRLAVVLVDNGMPLTQVAAASKRAGIDVREYLDLCRDPRHVEGARKLAGLLREDRVQTGPSHG